MTKQSKWAKEVQNAVEAKESGKTKADWVRDRTKVAESNTERNRVRQAAWQVWWNERV